MESTQENNVPPAALAEIGKILKEQRESLGIQINTVSWELKIRAKYIKAIEDGNIDDLPSGVYYGGYIKNYAKFLKLDSAALLRKVISLKEEKIILEPSLALPKLLKDAKQPNFVIIIASVLIISIVTLWFYFETKVDSKVSEKTVINNVLEEKWHTVMIRRQEDKLLSKTDIEQQNNETSAQVVLISKSTSNKIRVLGENKAVIQEKTLQSGETFFIPSLPEITVLATVPDEVELFTYGYNSSAN